MPLLCGEDDKKRRGRELSASWQNAINHSREEISRGVDERTLNSILRQLKVEVRRVERIIDSQKSPVP